jgi:glucose-1-phosphate adenylyltransferase
MWHLPLCSLPQISKEEMSRTVRGVVLAGGETKNPLTKYRAMPAVPLGSSLLMVDVPLNNCLQAGINKM